MHQDAQFEVDALAYSEPLKLTEGRTLESTTTKAEYTLESMVTAVLPGCGIYTLEYILAPARVSRTLEYVLPGYRVL